jgi:DNA polymerase III epsilon subunit-like protein
MAGFVDIHVCVRHVAPGGDRAGNMVCDVYYISLDFESTGLSKVSDQITEIGVCIGHHNRCIDGTIDVIATFSEYVRPTRAEISKGAEIVTGITREMLRDKDTVDQVLPRLAAFIDAHCTKSIPRVLVAYNGLQFDLPLLVAELSHFTNPEKFIRSLRLEAVMDPLVWGRTQLDKTKLLRRTNGRCSYKLVDVYKSITGNTLEGAHGATADCRAVLDLMTYSDMKEMCPNDFTTDSDYCRNPHAVVRQCMGTTSKTTTKKRVRTIRDMLTSPKRVKIVESTIV